MNSSHFKPGQSGNPNGRPPGSRNQKTGAAYDKYLGIFESNLDRLAKEVSKLEGVELANVLAKMAPYIFPALQRVTSTNIIAESAEVAEEYFRIGDKLLKF